MRLTNFKAIVIVPTTSLVAQMNSDFADYAKKDRWQVAENTHTFILVMTKYLTNLYSYQLGNHSTKCHLIIFQTLM